MKKKYENLRVVDPQSILDAISRKEKFSEVKKGVDLSTLAQSLALKKLENEKES